MGTRKSLLILSYRQNPTCTQHMGKETHTTPKIQNQGKRAQLIHGHFLLRTGPTIAGHLAELENLRRGEGLFNPDSVNTSL